MLIPISTGYKYIHEKYGINWNIYPEMNNNSVKQVELLKYSK